MNDRWKRKDWTPYNVNYVRCPNPPRLASWIPCYVNGVFTGFVALMGFAMWAMLAMFWVFIAIFWLFIVTVQFFIAAFTVEKLPPRE
jgi:hypothetical protein